MLRIYLDSSAIVKRYLSEPGSSTMDYMSDKGWAGEASITTSIWNVGEVLGVFDEGRRRRWLSENEFVRVLENLASETVRLLRLRILELYPLLTPILVEAWPLILKEYLYEADVLQIQTAIHTKSNIFLSSDKRLIDAASKIGLKAIDVKDGDKARELIK